MTANRTAAVLFLFLGAALLLFSPPATVGDALGDPGPALLPRLVGACIGLLAIVLFFQPTQQSEGNSAELERPAVIIPSLLAIPGFYLLFEYLGYTAATVLYLAVAACLLGARSKVLYLRYILFAIAFSLASGLLFGRWLDLPLPGIIP